MTEEFCYYEHRPTQVVAIKWDGTKECFEKINSLAVPREYTVRLIHGITALSISKFLFGTYYIKKDDFVVYDELGNIWPICPDSFYATYKSIAGIHSLTFLEAMSALQNGDTVSVQSDLQDGFDGYFTMCNGKVCYALISPLTGKEVDSPASFTSRQINSRWKSTGRWLGKSTESYKTNGVEDNELSCKNVCKSQ